MSFGKRLKGLRNSKDMTQTVLAETLGMSHSSIAMWETDSREPDSAMLVSIADYFNVTTDYLLCRNEVESFNQSHDKDEETMLRDFIRQEIGEYYQQQELTSSEDDAFYRQQRYISTLVQVQGIGHNVHAELAESIEKLKKLAYA